MKTKQQAVPADSNLLSAIRADDLKLLAPHWKVIDASVGDVLYEPGDNVNYTYFPCGPTIVSFIVTLEDARAVEMVPIGREGAVGGIVSQGHLPAYCRAVVQVAGSLLRIETIKLEKAKNESAYLRHFFARYSDALLSQVFQAVACNATHTIEQRAAKWLIGAVDRTGSTTLPITQEQLAGMLGVGRSYVGRVVSSMKNKGTIETGRGTLIISNPKQLKAMACDCDELVRKHFVEVLGGVYPAPKLRA